MGNNRSGLKGIIESNLKHEIKELKNLLKKIFEIAKNAPDISAGEPMSHDNIRALDNALSEIYELIEINIK